jgi:hypothetical protein
MTSRDEEMVALIGSLDLVMPNDPPASWRPACQTLQHELLAAEKIERRLRVAGPAIAAAAFIGFEAQDLPMTATALLGFIGICVVTMTFASDARARLSAAASIAPLVGWLSMLVPNANGYAALGLLLSLGINYLLSRIYPALEHRERIVFLLDYFGFRTENKNVAA